jgi:hypothetical protein
LTGTCCVHRDSTIYDVMFMKPPVNGRIGQYMPRNDDRIRAKRNRKDFVPSRAAPGSCSRRGPYPCRWRNRRLEAVSHYRCAGSLSRLCYASALDILIYVSLFWIAPFYGFFSPSCFVALNIVRPCPGRQLIEVLLAAAAMAVACALAEAVGSLPSKDR